MPESDASNAKASQSAAGAWLSLPGRTKSAMTGHDNATENDAGPNAMDGSSDGGELAQSRELTPPPLPPRPPLSQAGSLRLSQRTSRPQLLSAATTGLSLADVHASSLADTGSVQSSPASRAVSRKQSHTHLGRLVSNISDGDDSNSIKSYIPALEARIEDDSILGDVSGDGAGSDWPNLDEHTMTEEPFESSGLDDDVLIDQVEHEFDEIPNRSQVPEDEVLATWKSKLKHFFILSASGKPIYSRHGDDQLISHYVGVAQTLISFYQDAKDPLKGFVAGGTRFVMLSKGPLNLVAISRLPESDAQLRSQLEALYMQILSTLTLPSMEKMFSYRPSTDLRRPLQGTDVLLDGLADGFTRGSPSTLLSALECLRLRKTHRRAINDTLLKVRSTNLLYGLIVAAGRLVSVVRPKKHSLHPGDLHLIFNMLFEAGSVKANGGENWIPLCLPGFNNTGFLYMYVSFFTTSETAMDAPSERPTSRNGARDDELAIVLISANKDAFFEMKKMRDDLIAQMESNSSLEQIRSAIRRGHASTSQILPNTALRHFLYKSRANVQFVQPSFEPHFATPLNRRKMINLYAQMHESVHSRTAHLKVQHVISADVTGLAWETSLFEMYCVAGPNATREELVKGANKVVQWIRREEERVFIIGGAVF